MPAESYGDVNPNNTLKLVSFGFALFIIAIFTPQIVGFQYWYWHVGEISHIAYVIQTPTWALFYINSNLAFAMPQFEHASFLTIGFYISLLTSRIILAFVVTISKAGQASPHYFRVFGLGYIIVVLLACLYESTLLRMISIPGGPLIFIPGPSFGFTIFLPLPVLLLLGFYLVKTSPMKNVV